MKTLVSLLICLVGLLVQAGSPLYFGTFSGAVGGSSSTTNKQWSGVTFDSGRPVSSTFNGDQFSPTNNIVIQNLVLTNAAIWTGSDVLIGDRNNNYTNDVVIRDSVLFGKGYALRVIGGGAGGRRPTVHGYDSFFGGEDFVAEFYNAETRFVGCTFQNSNTVHQRANLISLNDLSTNLFIGCNFLAGPNDDGIAINDVTSSKFLGCNFDFTDGIPGTSTFFVSGDHLNCDADFVSCIFRMRGSVGIVQSVNSPLSFNDCYVLPATNGVCIDNFFAVSVRGGNLKAANFSNPGLVDFGTIDAATLTGGPIPKLIQKTGVTAGSTASAGNVGELSITNVTSSTQVSLSSGASTTVFALALTAGSWMISGNINFAAASATITSECGGIGAGNNILNTANGTTVCSGLRLTTTTETNSVTIPPIVINSGVSFTAYLVGNAAFSAGSVGAYGSMSAIRIQ